MYLGNNNSGSFTHPHAFLFILLEYLEVLRLTQGI